MGTRVEQLVDITVTAPTADELAELTRTLVEEGLVACGNIIPTVRSIYTWEGTVEDEPEALVFLHTRRDLIGDVIARITDEHPDETPQILVLPIAHVHDGYQHWVSNVTRPRQWDSNDTPPS